MAKKKTDKMPSKGTHGGIREGAGRPSTGRNDVTVKVEKSIVNKAKRIADHLGQPVAKIISDAARANIDKLYLKVTDEMMETAKKASKES